MDLVKKYDLFCRIYVMFHKNSCHCIRILKRAYKTPIKNRRM